MTETADKVFVVNFRPKDDYTSAKSYGELVYLTNGFVKLNRLKELQEFLNVQLASAKPSDYIILSGPAVLNTYIVLYLYAKFGFVNLLYWDSTRGLYQHNVITIQNMELNFERKDN